MALEEKTKACVCIRLQVRAERIVLFVRESLLSLSVTQRGRQASLLLHEASLASEGSVCLRLGWTETSNRNVLSDVTFTQSPRSVCLTTAVCIPQAGAAHVLYPIRFASSYEVSVIIPIL